MITEHEFDTCMNILAASFPDRKMDAATMKAYWVGLSDCEDGYLYLAAQDIIKTAKFFPRISEVREAYNRIWQTNSRRRATYQGDVIEHMEKAHGKDRRKWNVVPQVDMAAYRRKVESYWESERRKMEDGNG